MAIQQQQSGPARYVDLPDLTETFADSVHTMVWDGQTLRIEFCVTRFPEAAPAAANPDVAFEGCDFNAEHVAHARGLIEDAGLANLTVSQMSFEQASGYGENDVDVVVLHGILSWIEPASQRAVVSTLARRLRPNGVAYASYNCMPGWAPLAPIRHLMLEVKRCNPGNSE